MEKFSNYDSAREKANFEPTEKLPKGAYVCKILNVRYEKGEEGKSDMIVLQTDIIEGDYKDFFKTQYENNTSEDKKWKGIVRIYVPRDDGSEQDEWTRNAFAKWVAAIEDSNSGYKWDWKEEKWKNKILGIVYGETGTVIEGKEIVYTEARFGCSADKVREGKAPSAKFKAKNGYTGNGNSSAPAPALEAPKGEADEIPF
jgi:hypothetical protein